MLQDKNISHSEKQINNEMAYRSQNWDIVARVEPEQILYNKHFECVPMINLSTRILKYNKELCKRCKPCAKLRSV